MPNQTATWDIGLYTDCPGCKEFVNLVDADDFWESNQHLDIPEHGTERSKNVSVTCPKCNEEFFVDLEY